jgi:hypothetical protein
MGKEMVYDSVIFFEADFVFTAWHHFDSGLMTDDIYATRNGYNAMCFLKQIPGVKVTNGDSKGAGTSRMVMWSVHVQTICRN